MSIPLEELESVLADDAFWEADRFLEANELVRLLTADDWRALEGFARSRSGAWWEAFLASVAEVRSDAALDVALELMGDPSGSIARCGVSLLGALHPEVGSRIGDERLAMLAAAWRRFPAWRQGLAQAAWRLGVSKRLRAILGLDSWQQLARSE